MKLQRLVPALVGFLTATLHVAAVPLMARGPIEPSSDPFYQPPSGFESTKPGTILKSRQLGNESLAAAIFFKQNLAATWQFLYTTQDAFNKPTATVATVMIPHNADFSKLLSYQVAEDSPSINCAPSYNIQSGSNLKNVLPQLELIIMDTVLSKGIPVVTPDYQGPLAAFTCGPMSAHGVLDGIRAALSSTNSTGIQSNAQVQLWGYSGGALASGWAAQYAKPYASELNIIGASLGGTPVTVNATLNAVNKGVFAGLIPAGIIGLSNMYPELNAYMNSIVKPEKAAEINSVRNKCLQTLTIEYAFKDIGTYVNRTDYMADPIAINVVNTNTMGQEAAPSFPLHMYHAIHDEVVPYAPAEQMMKKWCGSDNKGANIEFVSDQLSEHVILMITGLADAYKWVMDRFNGVAVTPGCTQRTTVTSALDPGTAEIWGETVFNMLKALLGTPIGVHSL